MREKNDTLIDTPSTPLRSQKSSTVINAIFLAFCSEIIHDASLNIVLRVMLTVVKMS